MAKRTSPALKIALVLLVVLAALAAAFTLVPKGIDVYIRDDPPWFFPAVLEVEEGATVNWHLESPVVHPVMTLEGPVEIHSGHFTKVWSYTFTKPGIYVYICPIHPYMKGVIGVGQKVPSEKIPAWISWPPEYRAPPGQEPSASGEGRVWLDAQFHRPPGKDKPGTIIIINAETWEIEKVIDDQRLNNPHNLWEFGGNVLQTNWFDEYLSVIDKATGLLEQHIFLGESPAHVMSRPQGDKVYVTMQGPDELVILNSVLERTNRLRAPKGPHGHWISEDGRLMALASTEKGKISVWDLENDSVIFEAFVDGEAGMVEDEGMDEHTHSLPLMAGVTLDGRFAFVATSGTGKFHVFDIQEKSLVKSFDIGPVPIQTVPSPDGKYVLVPLTGSGEVAVVSTDSWEIAKKLPAGPGAHGVAYGQKQGGGWYAYVSSKFALWITVIDMDSLEVAGYIPLPAGAWGGQGILVTD